MSSMNPIVSSALAHVAAISQGGAIDPSYRINLHFHPDRPYRGTCVLAAIAADGVYRSQFVTRTSNGGLSAHPGGQRWAWEQRLFGGAYDEADADLRPKYGALNLGGNPYGASPRFGSCYLRLHAHALARATFCFPDSAGEPRHFGVADRFELAHLPDGSDLDGLDNYIEAQVHGVVDLHQDVEAIVLDPSFEETEIHEIAESLPFALEWHPGFRVNEKTIEAHPVIRGVEIAGLIAGMAIDGIVTPRSLGLAVSSPEFEGRDFKRVWHYLALHGKEEGK